MAVMRFFLVGWLVMILALGAGGVAQAQEESLEKRIGPMVADEAYAPAGFDPTESVGLFVGVNTFDDSRIGELKFAVDDAVDLAWHFWKLQLITAPRVRLGLSGEPVKPDSRARLAELLAAGTPEPVAPRRNRLLREISQASALSGPRGMFLFSFSSHGFYQNADALLCSDTVLDLNLKTGLLLDTSISHQRLISLINNARTPRKLVLIDACRENLDANRALGTTAAPLSREAMNALADVEGMAILLAARTGGFGYDGGTDHRGQPIQNGVFTHYFLEGMTGGAATDDPLITVDEVATHLESRVKAWVAANKAGSPGSAGIGKVLEGGEALPLAVSLRKREQAGARAQRLQEARTALALAHAADRQTITAELYSAVLEALDEWEAGKQDRLVTELLALAGDGNNARNRRYFAELAWPDIAASPTPTMTPIPSPSPSRTPRPTASPSPSPTPRPTASPSPSPSRTPAGPQAGDKKTIDLGGGVSMTLVYIPGGSFMMGSPSSENDRGSDEGPQRRVSLDGFWMGETEVTQAQWRAVMGNNPSDFSGDDRPVEQVSWNDAVEFCRKLSQRAGVTVRLPTEAQWEYACRAGSTTRYHFGDSDSQLRDYAWYSSNSNRQTHPVKQKRPNAWGLYDMHGNVWEWCSDWYQDSYSGLGTTNPTGPSSASFRVLRGGSWYDFAGNCRSAFRVSGNPTSTSFNLGFRVASVR